MSSRLVKKEKTRKALIGAACSLFRSRGFNQVGIRDLAKRCQISVGTFYNYFGSKEEVVFQIIEEIASGIRDEKEKFDKQVAGKPLLPLLILLMKNHLKHFSQHEYVIGQYVSFFDDPRLLGPVDESSLTSEFLNFRKHVADYRKRLWTFIHTYLVERGIEIPKKEEEFYTLLLWFWYQSNFKYWVMDNSPNKSQTDKFVRFSTKQLCTGLSAESR